GTGFLVAVRSAHGRSEGHGQHRQRNRHQHQRADRILQPQNGRRTALDDGEAVAAGGPAPLAQPARLVNRLRNRLILIFLAATLVPLLATLWITSAGSKYLLDFSTTGELDALSQSLEQTGRKFYQRAMDDR